MENVITRGTTASLTIDLTEAEFDVAGIVEVALVFETRGNKVERGLDNVTITDGFLPRQNGRPGKVYDNGMLTLLTGGSIYKFVNGAVYNYILVRLPT